MAGKTVYTGERDGSFMSGNLKSVCSWFGIEYAYTRKLLLERNQIMRHGVKITSYSVIKRKRKRK